MKEINLFRKKQMCKFLVELEHTFNHFKKEFVKLIFEHLEAARDWGMWKLTIKEEKCNVCFKMFSIDWLTYALTFRSVLKTREFNLYRWVSKTSDLNTKSLNILNLHHVGIQNILIFRYEFERNARFSLPLTRFEQTSQQTTNNKLVKCSPPSAPI